MACDKGKLALLILDIGQFISSLYTYHIYSSIQHFLQSFNFFFYSFDLLLGITRFFLFCLYIVNILVNSVCLLRAGCNLLPFYLIPFAFLLFFSFFELPLLKRMFHYSIGSFQLQWITLFSLAVSTVVLIQQSSAQIANCIATV